MRPKPHVLLLVAGGAGALLVSAPALGAAWLSPEIAALSASQIEHSPAIAIDPAGTRAAVVADDGQSAVAARHRRHRGDVRRYSPQALEARRRARVARCRDV